MKNDNKDSSSLKEWLENYGFAINVNSVDTKNSQRDKTLVDSFFSLFATTINYLPKDKFITGQTLQVIGPKKIIAQLDLNGMKKEVPVTYEYAQEWLKITGSIDLLDFQLHKAHATLHKACYELHKGEDGVSKTWTQVDFEGKIKIHKTCK
ncbi:MAG: YceI family protein, partial [Bdellovibrionales bacterium]|nr:YceI family protein [Bdellovibrionales bacterium]